ncbi:MAG TPA: Ig-like domain repeat protein [Edaphobacter sp.]|nr:Ig-like domain repeat protein [Edaphobacter sp.]
MQATAVPIILPSAIAYDSTGNLYIAETGNHVVRKVDTGGIVTTVAGTGTQGYACDNGPATAARLDSPQGLALDGNNLYIADTHNQRIRRLDLTTGVIITIAGSTVGFSGDNGPATAAQFNLPTALAVDANHNLYIADSRNHRIRRITPAGVITTVGGNGIQGFGGDNGLATAASIDSPAGLAVDAAGDLYLSDTHNHRIRKIAAATGVITTIAGGEPGLSGDGGPAVAATLALPHGLSIDSAGDIYIADTANHRIRRIDGSSGAITTIAGNGTENFSGDKGPATVAALDSPRATAIAPTGLVTLADTNDQRVRQLDLQSIPAIHTIAGLSSTPVEVLTLTAPPSIVYGSGQLTAALASPTATGSIIFTLLDPGTASGTTLETAPVAASTATFDTSALSVGSYSILAAYTGDATHSATQSRPLTVTITPRPLTATPDPITLLYGQPIPVLTGTLVGDLPQDDGSLTARFTAPIAPLSPVATYPISATLVGAAAKNYAFVSTPASVTIAPAPTLTTLVPSTTSVSAGAPVTFTSATASTTAGTPTGTVFFNDGATTLLDADLPASFTTSTLAPGQHTITTVYRGDRNFIASTSAPLLITVIPASANAPDFTLAPSGALTQTIPSGGVANFNFTLQIQGAALSSPITLAAFGLPPLATASFNPGYLPPGTTPATFTLTINTPQTAALYRYPGSGPMLAFILFPIAGMALRRRIRCGAIVFVIVASTLTLCAGCGSRINTGGATANPVKTYTITVTGTATSPTGGVLEHSTTVSLLVESAK